MLTTGRQTDDWEPPSECSIRTGHREDLERWRQVDCAGHGMTAGASLQVECCRSDDAAEDKNEDVQQLK